MLFKGIFLKYMYCIWKQAFFSRYLTHFLIIFHQYKQFLNINFLNILFSACYKSHLSSNLTLLVTMKRERSFQIFLLISIFFPFYFNWTYATFQSSNYFFRTYFSSLEFRQLRQKREFIPLWLWANKKDENKEFIEEVKHSWKIAKKQRNSA